MTVGSPLGYYTYGLQMSEGLGDVSSKPLVQGETTFVVVKISKDAPGAGITYRMYLDPTVGAAEPSYPAAIFTLGPVQSLPTSLSIDNGTGFTTDELRVGTTWGSVLPAKVSNWIDQGFAKPGIQGAPHLVGTGPLSPDSAFLLTLTDANPLARALLFVGTDLLNAPFMGGTLVTYPVLSVKKLTSATGSADVHATWPGDVPPGVPIYFQYWIVDPIATFGVSASNGLKGISQ